ncbi:MAG TPA: nickel-dependent lactate racemase [Thermoplasmatales archaeon]|nr:nickel-dependent lactate racemase [Thermoplasmatales archaeon]
MQIKLPYGEKEVVFEVPDKNLLDIILPKEYIAPARPESIMRNAIMNPMGRERLSEITGEGDTVAIVVEDHTRPCPTPEILQLILDEISRAGVNDSDVIIIIGNGMHVPPDFETIKKIVGDKVTRNYRVITNDVVSGEYIMVGKTKYGNEVEVLREYVESDVKIVTGVIGYHYFAGYDGTRRSILPGVSSMKTIQFNHRMMFDENARAGELRNNPVHHDMNDAMRLAGCDFAFNVVLNSNRRVVGAWAGNPDSVLDAGTKVVDEMYKIKVEEKADIVITAASGYPHDIDLFQACKAMHMAMHAVEKDGVIILVGECKNGHGNEIYYEWMKKHSNSDEVKKALMERFIAGAHKAYYHFKAIEDFNVILVSEMDEKEVKEVFRMCPEKNLENALNRSFDIVGKDARVRVIPYGTNTLLTL